MARSATRIGDLDFIHDCEFPKRLDCSKNVFVNGRGWSRMGDVNTPHKYGGDCDKTHLRPIAVGSKTVFVNGRGAGRILDYVAGCTFVLTGSRNVFAGG